VIGEDFMNELEKRLSGELYDNQHPDMINQLERSRTICFEFNHTNPLFYTKKEELLRGLLGQVKNKFYIEQPFHCDFGSNIFLGENFYSNYNLTILDCNKVSIGDNCLIGPNVTIITVNHPLDSKLRNKSLEYALPVTIGNDVWIGASAVINPGVVIGNNVVIGSGSVVTKDLPDNVVAVGNPCRVIKTQTQ